jgi:hypothetical protein
MGHDATKGRWRERAAEMLSIAQTMQDPETKAQMERLAADWLWMAEQVEQVEESRSERDDAAAPPPQPGGLGSESLTRRSMRWVQPCPATAP